MRSLPDAAMNAKHVAAIISACGEPVVRSNWSMMDRETQVAVWQHLGDGVRDLIKRVKSEGSHAQ